MPPAIPEPPMPVTTIARGRPAAMISSRSVSWVARTAVLTCAADEATWRSVSAGSAAASSAMVSRRSCASTVIRLLRGGGPHPPAGPECRPGPGRPGRRSRSCTPVRWPPRRRGAGRGTPGRPGGRAAIRRCSQHLPGFWSGCPVDPAYPIGRGAPARPGLTRPAADDAEDLVAQRGQRRLVGCFRVEPQQRLGVGRAEVEPPPVAADGEAVEAVQRNPWAGREGPADLLRRRCLVADLAVDLAGGHVPAVTAQQLG